MQAITVKNEEVNEEGQEFEDSGEQYVGRSEKMKEAGRL